MIHQKKYNPKLCNYGNCVVIVSGGSRSGGRWDRMGVEGGGGDGKVREGGQASGVRRWVRVVSEGACAVVGETAKWARAGEHGGGLSLCEVRLVRVI